MSGTERRNTNRDSGVRLTLDPEPPQPEEEEQQEAEPEFQIPIVEVSDENSEGSAGIQSDDEEDDMAVQAAQVNSIETLTGESGAEAERFVSTMERLITLYTWTDTQACNIAQMKFKGAAQDWIRAEAALGITYTSWAGVEANPNANPPVAAARSLRAELEKRFGETKTVGTAVAAMANLKQRHNETVSSFYDRVRLAVEKKNYNVPAADRNDAYRAQMREDIRTFLICGLRKEYQERVLGVANPPDTLEEIMSTVRAAEKEYDTQVKAMAALGDKTQENRTSEEEEGPMISAVGRGRGYVGGQRGTTGGMTRGRGDYGRNTERVRCYYCNNLGHMVRECRKKQSDIRRGNYQGPRGRGYTGRGAYGADRARPVNALEYDRAMEEWRQMEPVPPVLHEGEDTQEFEFSEN